MPAARSLLGKKPSSPLVKTLTADADVYSLAYGQNASVDDVARVRSLGQHITGLRAAGYSEVVLVGYSAGALLARYYQADIRELAGLLNRDVGAWLH